MAWSAPRTWTTGETVTAAIMNAHVRDNLTYLKTQQDLDDTHRANGGTAKHIAQVVVSETGAVATGSTIIPLDDTIPQNTEGDQYMSVAITPTSATSTLVIDVVVYLASHVTAHLIAALFQDTTANALAAVSLYNGGAADAPFMLAFRHTMAAGTTSATTFKVRAGGHAAGTTTFNGSGGVRMFGGKAASSITVTEVLP